MHGNEPYPPEMAGFFKDIKKKVTKVVKKVKGRLRPPKHIRKKLAKFKEKVARKLKPPKWVRKALTPPKWARKVLTPPKAIRKVILGKVGDVFIKAIGFLPIPGARVVKVALKALQTASKQAVEYDEAKRQIRRAAEQQAAMEMQSAKKRRKQKGLAGPEENRIAQEVDMGLKVIMEALEGADLEAGEYETRPAVLVVPEEKPFPWEIALAAAGGLILFKYLEDR